jgi:hypothetical protein
VSLRKLCRSLGLDFAGQYTKLQKTPWAGIEIISIPDARGHRQKVCVIDLESLPMWLVTILAKRGAANAAINPGKVDPMLQAEQTCCDYHNASSQEVPNKALISGMLA